MPNQPLSRNDKQLPPPEVWVAQGRISKAWEFVCTAAPDERNAAHWHRYVLASSVVSETAATTGDDQAAILAVLNKALYPESGCEIPDLYTAAKTIAAEYAMLQEKLNAVRSATAPMTIGGTEAAALQALADIKWDIHHCDWSCDTCGADQRMDETDIAMTIRHFEDKNTALPDPYREDVGATDSSTHKEAK